MMSACVKWAKAHIDQFNELLARQLSGFDRAGEVWNESIATAKEQAELMAEVGLDFKSLVGTLPPEEEDPDIF
jgi:hypothetical protein